LSSRREFVAALLSKSPAKANRPKKQKRFSQGQFASSPGKSLSNQG
jgi:hypothetical protein